MGRIFYVMGKSSVGKDTIYNMLVNDKELGLKTIVGYTTRPMREGEVNGREYFFVNEDELKKLEQAGKVIEKRGYNTVYGVWNYFTVDDENINLNENNYVLIGTLESYRNVRDYYGNEVVVPIYIEVEDGIRLIRAINREMTQNTPKYEELCRRFLADAKDFAEEILDELDIKKRYNNENLDKCYEEIKGEILRLKQ
ncbi:MAG: guanylate kinase [Lachnospiraceae bacterium]|nr:guanylate kinase [Lachnospiraceae bacterium]